jgi:pimeloyl-ACP methyl ester carboxylesterase
MNEKAILFGKAKSLVGIITEPDSLSANDSLPAIVILNAGFVHRVGPNRLHVKMAREMAGIGFLVLRFDFSGIGDSDVSGESIPFEEKTLAETQQAMDYLATTRNKEKFMLVGICSGADVAFRTACCERRVAGIVGINGYYLDHHIVQQLSPRIKNSTQQRYYSKHLFDHKSWWRLITGRSDFKSLVRFLLTKLRSPWAQNVQVQPMTDTLKRWRVLIDRRADLLLVYSEGSTALDSFRLALRDRLGKSLASERLTVEIIQHSDHVFTLLSSQRTLVGLLRQWLQSRHVSCSAARSGL